MTIKSDRWIRRMAEQGMIEPFEPFQVREGAHGRVISYGTSSYGYDVRCADEFKIFTNINSTIIDPKNFDSNSFVDFKADVCIIPPNSFVLARTVEYFRIPRNVLTICLGKCLTAETRVVDAESGAYLPIVDFAFGRMTIGMQDWHLKPVKVGGFLPQGIKPVYELTTKTGLKIQATANHPFRQLHGWTALNQLKRGDRIAVAREIPIFGKTPLPDWEAILLGLMIPEGQCKTPGYSPTFSTGDAVLADLVKQCVKNGGLGEVTFNGQYGYRLVNKAGRGGKPERNRAYQWLIQHQLNVTAESKFVPQAIFMSPKETTRLFLRALFSGDGGVYRSGEVFYIEYYSKSRRLIEDVHHLLLRFGILSLIRHKITAINTDAYRVQITDREQIQRFAKEIGFWAESIKQVRLEQEILPAFKDAPHRLRSNFDTLPQAAWELMKNAVLYAGTSLNQLVVSTRPTQSLPYTLANQVAVATQYDELSLLVDGPVWDVVTDIQFIGEKEVFDLNIPNVHNFLANDIIVHNSTYARCFRGDTRVALVDGSAPTLEEMAIRAEQGELFWGYSIGANGRLIVTQLDAPRYIGRDSLIEMKLDNEKSIFATPDHLFMLRDGHWMTAGELKPGASLMPLYRQLARGYEMVYQPLNGHLYPTHRLADEWNLRHGLPKNHRHIEHARQGERMKAVRERSPDRHLRQAELASLLNCDRAVFGRFPHIIDSFRGHKTAEKQNHKVVSVRPIAGDHDVFCLTVPEAGNFALDNGVFVHNCGIIVNVTPLEPEWEGHVTLEFSNTTPLPAKIYANEGIAQILFFESDEICATSYKDRNGKYQGQRGVTLPKS